VGFSNHSRIPQARKGPIPFSSVRDFPAVQQIVGFVFPQKGITSGPTTGSANLTARLVGFASQKLCTRRVIEKVSSFTRRVLTSCFHNRINPRKR
jgi:hypothetical protein